MRKRALFLAVSALILPLTGRANAATGSDLIVAAQSFVRTGLSNVDSSFAQLRGTPIKQSPGEHYQVNTAFGPFLPDCHISGYQPPQVPHKEWVFSCNSPGLSANVNMLHALIYQGVVRALPACFTRTLNPALRRDELFRFDCHEADRGISVDVSSTPTSNGDPSFLLEVYENVGALTPPMTPSPAPTPNQITLVKPQPTLDIGGVSVPYADYATLSLALHVALTGGGKPPVPHVVQSVKAGNEMPAFDWAWHYTGKSTNNGEQSISVWICGNLSPQEQADALKEATLMGLLDSGLGGAALQQAYTTALAADQALGPQAEDPFVNRHKLINAMYRFFR